MGRLGMLAPAADLGHEVSVRKGACSGSRDREFVWEPFLLAERLEAAGAKAFYGSTTRSPIAVGYAIESAISFTDNYGLGIPNLSITSPTSSLTAFLCVLRHPQKVLTRSFLRRWLRLRPSWRLLPMNKPVVLSDLDDTLFQTRRKMVDELALEPFRTGAVDRTLNPRSFMTEEQSMLVDWLEQAELIPVTARELKKSAAYGSLPLLGNHHARAVILTPEGNPDEEWKAHMLGQLAPYQEKLTSMQRLITEMMDAKGLMPGQD
jgi:hypothetical protein